MLPEVDADRAAVRSTPAPVWSVAEPDPRHHRAPLPETCDDGADIAPAEIDEPNAVTGCEPSDRALIDAEPAGAAAPFDAPDEPFVRRTPGPRSVRLDDRIERSASGQLALQLALVYANGGGGEQHRE